MMGKLLSLFAKKITLMESTAFLILLCIFSVIETIEAVEHIVLQYLFLAC